MTYLPGGATADQQVNDYQNLYSLLGTAYWEASTLDNKDLIQGLRDQVYNVITLLNQAQLAANTQLLLEATQQMKTAEVPLQQLKKEIQNITRNIATAAKIANAVDAVLKYGSTVIPK